MLSLIVMCQAVMLIQDQTAHSQQADLDLYWLQKQQICDRHCKTE